MSETKSWVSDGNFYTTGEYAKTLEDFDIFGVSFKSKVDSVINQLDYDTLQILKVLLTDYQAPADLDLRSSLNVVATLDFIQSRLSNDNKTETIPTKNFVFNSRMECDDV